MPTMDAHTNPSSTRYPLWSACNVHVPTYGSPRVFSVPNTHWYHAISTLDGAGMKRTSSIPARAATSHNTTTTIGTIAFLRNGSRLRGARFARLPRDRVIDDMWFSRANAYSP